MTISSYMSTAQRFLTWLGKKKSPTEADYDRYFADRRRQGISERTLLTQSFQIQKLAQANGWPWNYTADDRPLPKDEPFQAVLTMGQIEQLIMAQKKYTDGERFYLAVGTVFACRREALSQIKKRHYDDKTILIHGVHKGRTIRHLIPDGLKPIFAEYRSREHNPTSLSEMFQRICRKADMQLDKGFGWDSVRRILDSEAEYFLAENRLPASLWGDFVGWSKATKGQLYPGSRVDRRYSHPEIPSGDPCYIDRLVFAAIPCL